MAIDGGEVVSGGGEVTIIVGVIVSNSELNAFGFCFWGMYSGDSKEVHVCFVCLT